MTSSLPSFSEVEINLCEFLRTDHLSVVIDDFIPSISIELSYPSKHKVVELGNSIKPKHVGSKPVFNMHFMDNAPTPTSRNNATYILALTDPDATSRSDPAKAQMCHWIATNITMSQSFPVSVGVSEEISSSSSVGENEAGGITELMSYFPPTPPPKTGYHRYVFVVLRSKVRNDEMQLTKPKDRPHWGYGKIGAGVREWAEENSLLIVGE